MLDSYDVAKQLRCAGMLEAIRIRKQGFAIRMQMEDFIKRYRIIFGTKSYKYLTDSMTLKEQSETIIEEALKAGILEHEQIQIGLTKIFMKEEARVGIEQSMARAIKQQIVMIQTHVRMFNSRKLLFKMKKSK